jgi:hypothetical protein
VIASPETTVTIATKRDRVEWNVGAHSAPPGTDGYVYPGVVLSACWRKSDKTSPPLSSYGLMEPNPSI